MHRRSRSTPAACALLALSLLVPITACGDEPVSPLPVDARTPAASATVSPSSPSASPGTPSVRPRTRVPNPPATAPSPRSTPSPTPPPTPACQGAVIVTVHADSELGLVTSICLATGGVLRVAGTGPGTASADPADMVSQSYGGGVEVFRFLSPGAVTITVERDGQTYPISVVVR